MKYRIMGLTVIFGRNPRFYKYYSGFSGIQEDIQHKHGIFIRYDCLSDDMY